MKKIFVITAVLSMSASAFSQNILDLPIRTTYGDHPAILISVPQMDSINISFSRLKLTRALNSSLRLKLHVAENENRQLNIKYNTLKNRFDILSEANGNQIKITDLTTQKLTTELEYYKDKKSPKTKNFLIGVLTGIAACGIGIAIIAL